MERALNQISWDLVGQSMYFWYHCDWQKSGNLEEIVKDFMNDILKYEGQKLCDVFQWQLCVWQKMK